MENEKLSNFEKLMYLGFEKSKYYDKRFSYEIGESPEDRINKLLSQKENVLAREEMYKNLEETKKQLSELTPEQYENQSFDDLLLNMVEAIAVESAKRTQNTAQIGFLSKLRDPQMLVPHLGEVGDSMVSFFKTANRGKSNLEQILPNNKPILMEFVGRTHDIFKLLGTPNAQIDPDHEVIYKEVLGKFLAGKTFISSSGETIVFTEADVSFVCNIVVSHEDIWREKDFAKQASSLKKNIQTEDTDLVERGRSILHFIDIFGDAVRFDENGILTIVDRKAFRSRFIDLYQRHIKLPLQLNTATDGNVDWTKAKVYRPQWGMYGVSGLTETFELLRGWGIIVDDDLVNSVTEGVVEVLKKADSSISDSLGENKDYKIIIDTASRETDEVVKEYLKNKQDQIKILLGELEGHQN